jgi:hypothetical protein
VPTSILTLRTDPLRRLPIGGSVRQTMFSSMSTSAAGRRWMIDADCNVTTDEHGHAEQRVRLCMSAPQAQPPNPIQLRWVLSGTGRPEGEGTPCKL